MGRPAPSGLLDDGQFSEAPDDNSSGAFHRAPDQRSRALAQWETHE